MALDDGQRVDAFALPSSSRAASPAPRTTFLSPFDPLIKDRARTERLFGYRYRLEMYVPRAKRQFGFFVLPVLHDNRLIGRIDPTMDRRASCLTVGTIHLQPDAPRTGSTGRAVISAVRDLAGFLDAKSIEITTMPGQWRSLYP